MIRHIIILTLKENVNGLDRATNAARLQKELMACANCVPGIKEFEVAVAQPGLEATGDLVLNSLFESKEALDAYQVHPLHQAVKTLIGEMRESRVCMDYEISA